MCLTANHGVTHAGAAIFLARAAMDPAPEAKAPQAAGNPMLPLLAMLMTLLQTPPADKS
jgi:hypothetical protein